MTQSLSNVTLNPAQWTDLTTVYPSIAGARVLLRYMSGREARVFHGGAGAPPSLVDGDALLPRETVLAVADHIWVTGEGALSITQL